MHARLVLLSLLVIIPICLAMPTGIGPAFAALQISDVTKTIALNSTSPTLHVMISSEQAALSPLAVLMALNATSEDSRLSLREVKAFDNQDNSYTIALDESQLPSNGTTLMINREMLPSGLPAGGGFSIAIDLTNAVGSHLLLTLVYAGDSEATIRADVVDPATVPFDVVETHSSMEITGNSTNEQLKIDNFFISPEIHCETCTRVEYDANFSDSVEAAYVTNQTDLGLAQKMSFWAMGEGDVTFNVAGKVDQNETVSYAKSVDLSLDDEWQQVELDLSTSDLGDVTHLFGFSVGGTEAQTFYLKGAVYS
jgi:hypothetical protein